MVKILHSLLDSIISVDKKYYPKILLKGVNVK